MIKIWRSPFLNFHSPIDVINTLDIESYTALEIYTDNELRSISNAGFNGVWLHAVLHNLVKSPEFPEFGVYAETQLERLRELTERAAKHGVKVYLFMQPPRAINGELDFWRNHRDAAGATEILDGWDNLTHPTPFISLCTSTEKVRRHIRGSFACLSKELPDLGGYIIISASEYPGHCYVRPITPERHCPRCAKRSSSEVIAELLSLIHSGIRDSSQTQALIAWNWSWSFVADERAIIERLPKDIIYMADFERGGRRPEARHPDHIIDEYALCYAGPSERYLETVRKAASQGLPIMAKLQLGTTHELASVPNTPVLATVFEKAKYLRQNPVEGFMGCWNFGCMLTANTAAFNYFLSDESPPELDAALESFAEKYFSNADSRLLAKAWKCFSEALSSWYPHSNDFLYSGPVSWALGYFSPPGPLHGSGNMSFRADERGDDISAALGYYSAAEVAQRLGQLAAEWKKGTELLRMAMTNSKDGHATEELASAVVCGAAFRSAYNFMRMYEMKLKKGGADGDEYLKIQADELDNVREALPFVESDLRQGYHSEAHAYLFDAPRLRKKISLIQALLSGDRRDTRPAHAGAEPLNTAL